MLKYLGIFFTILACCLFALLLEINSGEWVEKIGCCDKSMQKKLQRSATPETDAPETERLLLSD